MDGQTHARTPGISMSPSRAFRPDGGQKLEENTPATLTTTTLTTAMSLTTVSPSFTTNHRSHLVYFSTHRRRQHASATQWILVIHLRNWQSFLRCMTGVNIHGSDCFPCSGDIVMTTTKWWGWPWRNRSRSSIFELGLEFLEMYDWCEYGSDCFPCSRDIVMKR